MPSGRLIAGMADDGPFADRPECGAKRSLAAIIGATVEPNFHTYPYRGKPWLNA